MRFHMISVALVLALGVLSACSKEGDKEGDDGEGGGGDEGNTGVNNVVLTSSSLSSFALTQDGDCTLVEGLPATASGSCATPINVKGAVSKIALDTRGRTNTAPARILAGAEDLEGADDIFFYSAFDFAEGPQLEGNNNISETAIDFDMIQLSLKWLEIKLAATSDAKYYSVRYMFINQPAMKSSAAQSCFDSSRRTQLNDEGDLIPGQSFDAGDIMVCVKDTAEEVCSNSDFRFVNSSTGALSNTRPASPLALSGEHLLQEDSCSGDFTQSHMLFNVGVANPFKLTAKTEVGEKGPVTTYSFTPESGAASKGEDLTINVDFTTRDSVFVPDDVDLESLTQAEFLKRLDDILLIPLYLRNYASNEGDGFDPVMRATVSVDLK